MFHLKSGQKRKLQIAVLLFILLIGFVFIPFAGAIKETFSGIILAMGLVGLGMVVLVLDLVFVQPVSPMIFMILAIFSGINWFEAFLVAATFSWIAGLIDFGLGRYVGKDFFERIVNPEKMKKAQALFRKHGSLVVILGAMSPIPFSITSWMAGISGMRFFKFARDSLIARFLGFFISALLAVYGLLSLQWLGF